MRRLWVTSTDSIVPHHLESTGRHHCVLGKTYSTPTPKRAAALQNTLIESTF